MPESRSNALYGEMGHCMPDVLGTPPRVAKHDDRTVSVSLSLQRLVMKNLAGVAQHDRSGRSDATLPRTALCGDITEIYQYAIDVEVLVVLMP